MDGRLIIDQKDFRRYAITQVPAPAHRQGKKTSRDGFEYISVCEELIDGRWEGFVSMHTWEEFAAENLAVQHA